MVMETWLRIGMWTYEAQRTGKLAVVSNLPPALLVWQDFGDERGSELFFNGLLENFDSKHSLGIHFLELRIFFLQSLQAYTAPREKSLKIFECSPK